MPKALDRIAVGDGIVLITARDFRDVARALRGRNVFIGRSRHAGRFIVETRGCAESMITRLRDDIVPSHCIVFEMPTDCGRPKFWILLRVIIASSVVLLIGSTLLVGLDQDGGRDWDYFQADLLSARQSILDHGELPLWMPHRSGGHDAFADPQSAWLSPFGLLVFVFNFPVGARLYLVACACFGALGAIQLGKDLRLSPWACGLMSVILYLSMPMGLYAAGGIPSFTIGWAILPWLVLLVQRGTPWSTFWAGLILAVGLYSGDPNHFVWHSLFLAVFGLVLSIFRQTWKPFAAVLMTGVAAAVLALPKMLPMWLMSREHPRLVGLGGPANTLRLTYHALLHPFPPFLEHPHGEFVCFLKSGELVSSNLIHPRLVSNIVPGTRYDWVNVGCYVGWLAVLLAAIGILKLLVPAFRDVLKSEQNRDRSKAKAKPTIHAAIALVGHPVFSVVFALTLASFVFFLLSLGKNLTPNLWDLLHRLPVFSSLKDPIRLLVYVLLPMSLLAGIGLDALLALARNRLDQQATGILAGALVSLILFDVHLPTRHLYSVAFCEPALVVSTTSSDCFQHEWDGRQNTSTLYGPPVTAAVRAKKGLVNGYTVFSADTNVAACSSDTDRSDVHALNDRSATAKNIEFTARSIRFTYRAEKQAQFIVNQNWEQGWEVVEPKDAQVSATDDGRIAVAVPKGEGEAQLQYTPPGLYAGMIGFVLLLPMLLGCVTFLQRRSQSRLEEESREAETSS